MGGQKAPAPELAVPKQAEDRSAMLRRMINADFEEGTLLLRFDRYNRCQKKGLQAVVREEMLRKFGFELDGDGGLVYVGTGAGGNDLLCSRHGYEHNANLIGIHLRLRREQLLLQGLCGYHVAHGRRFGCQQVLNQWKGRQNGEGFRVVYPGQWD